jgi:hypothetical protein
MAEAPPKEVPLDLLLIVLMIIIFFGGVIALARSPVLHEHRYGVQSTLSRPSG